MFHTKKKLSFFCRLNLEYLCVCVCVCVCVYVPVLVRIRVCVYISLFLFVFMCVYVRARVCADVYQHISLVSFGGRPCVSKIYHRPQDIFMKVN
jgi:hypothetical protein